MILEDFNDWNSIVENAMNQTPVELREASVTLSVGDWEYVMDILAERRYADVADIMGTICDAVQEVRNEALDEYLGAH